MKRAGILGGTFDPPHIGHLIMAEEARLNRNLDEVWWLPNAIPPHKAVPSESTVNDRLAMVRSVTETDPSFRLCDIEIKRPGRSYTVDTVEELIHTYPDVQFEFIMGGDSLSGFHQWHKADQLSTLLPFTVLLRPGYALPETLVPKELVILDDVSLEVSSTEIRERIRQGNNNRFLLYEKVYDYIKERGLYE
ncbi:nicotinate-nucleotide adenylyltransferase [Salisediminibacterium selenitireducens]|uniref:Probable nicotinate-nucleotide adenylyltransferase n=1 Tax=Bacillus selenitireducens (strain ATCC 700615 / DSM 15326 / MLS10) TaxID=439292 RepID=D6XWC9_BACIE|nr:nicotinate-nucleotide adenylyltransferase [Salisediminibacterium selenitireducens]ADH99883.1 nicotinate (nicotinamide) nucleotide adenylyltransferase [[Bacillus] selenitireducens MLS10]